MLCWFFAKQEKKVFNSLEQIIEKKHQIKHKIDLENAAKSRSNFREIRGIIEKMHDPEYHDERFEGLE